MLIEEIACMKIVGERSLSFSAYKELTKSAKMC